jgi:PAS domain S-box-containing protein
MTYSGASSFLMSRHPKITFNDPVDNKILVAGSAPNWAFFWPGLCVVLGPTIGLHVNILLGGGQTMSSKQVGTRSDESQPSATDTGAADHLALEAANKILTATIQSDSLADHCKTCLSELERASGARFGWIGEINERGTLDTLAMSDPGWDACLLEGERPMLVSDMAVRGIWGEVIKTGKPLVVNDPGAHPSSVGLPDGHPLLNSFLGYPLIREGQVIGMISLGNREGGFTEKQLEIVGNLAPVVLETLHRKRLEIQVAESNKLLSERVDAQTHELKDAVAALTLQHERLLAILDAHPENVYVTDPETYEVLYCNKHFRSLLGTDPIGKKCHEEFQGLPSPCDFCTNAMLLENPDQPHRWQFHNKLLDLHFDITDLLIDWYDGRKVRFELAVDVTERVRNELQFRTVLDTARDGFWVCDGRGKILEVNPRLTEMLGYEQHELIGMFVSDIDALETPGQTRERIESIIEAGSAIFETAHRCKDGTLLDVEVSTTYLDIAGGRFFVFARDISERRRHERERERLIQKLSRSNADLEQFAYLASHDLQEPLRKVQAFSDRLSSLLPADLDPRGMDYLDRILGATGRMQTLINDLLSYSRIGTRAKPHQAVDLNQILGRVIETLEFRLEKTGGSIQTCDLPSLEAEPTQMQILLQNLLNNALKFHRPDIAPEVIVEAALDSEMVEIRIKDNGIGIDAKYGERVFGIFQRLHSREDYEGTGIGLAVCQRIVERHGGEIRFESGPGTGTTFIVRLPLRQAGQEES